MMHATCRPHAHVGLLVVTAVAVAVALVSAAEVDYTYTCPGTPPVTVQVADLPCGCLAERKQLTKVLGCAQSDQFSTVLDACRTCAKRSDCNCSAPAEVLHPVCAVRYLRGVVLTVRCGQVEDQSSGGESDADEEKRAFRETVNNDFPWLPAIGAAVAAVALCAGCLCLRDKWRKMEEVVRASLRARLG